LSQFHNNNNDNIFHFLVMLTLCLLCKFFLLVINVLEWKVMFLFFNKSTRTSSSNCPNANYFLDQPGTFECWHKSMKGSVDFKFTHTHTHTHTINTKIHSENQCKRDSDFTFVDLRKEKLSFPWHRELWLGKVKTICFFAKAKQTDKYF